MQQTLRAYQQTIVRSAVEAQGGIVYLPTGAGKTLIAAEVVRQSFESQIAQARETDSDVPVRNTAVIVVPTVALLTQQRESFDKFFASRMPNAVECLKIEGGRAFPTLDSKKKFHVLVGVSQALRNNLPSINPNTVVILVVDEVHHCTGQHPSAAVAQWARDLTTPPWILGLTASLSYARHEGAIAADIVAVCDCLGVKNSSIFSSTPAELEAGGYHAPAAADPISITLERHEKRIRNLEGCDHRLPQAVLGIVAQSRSQTANVEDAGVMPLFTACFDALLVLEDRVAETYAGGNAAKRSKLRAFQNFIDGEHSLPFGDLSDVAGKLFLDLMDAVDTNTFLPAIEQLRKNCPQKLEEHMVLAAYLHLCDVVHLLTVTKQEAIEVAFWYLKDFALPELMHPSVSVLCRELVELLLACSSADDDEVTQELTGAMGHDVPKVVKLLEDWLNETESSEKAAVFATHRLTVAVLAKRLNAALQDERPNVAMPLYARGQRVGWHVGGKLSNTAFNERIATFRNDSNVNIIVATQVCEEGLDIPSCSYVIHFDPPLNPVSHVQRAGRARAEGSAVHVLGNVKHLVNAVSQQHLVAAAAADGQLLHMTPPATVTIPGQQDSDLQRRMAKVTNFRTLLDNLMSNRNGKTSLQVLNELLQCLGSPPLDCNPEKRSRSSDVFEVSHVKVTLLHPTKYRQFTLECPRTFSGSTKKQVQQDAAEGMLEEIRTMFLRNN